MAVHGGDAREQEVVVGDVSSFDEIFRRPRLTRAEQLAEHAADRRAQYDRLRARGEQPLAALAITYLPWQDFPSRPKLRVYLRSIGEPWHIPAPLTKAERNERAYALWLIRKGWIMGPRANDIGQRRINWVDPRWGDVMYV